MFTATRQSVLLLVLCACVASPTLAQNQADEERAKSQFNTAARMFQDGQYESAIREWNELLTNFPNSSYYRDSVHFTGLAYYNLQQYDKAAGKFTELRETLADINDFKRAEKMLFYLAFSLHQVGKNQQDQAAIETLRRSTDAYKQLIENFTESQTIPEALYFQGEAYYELSLRAPNSDALANATASYKKVLDEFPDNNRVAPATYAYGVCLEDAGEYLSAATVYSGFIDSFPEDNIVNQVRLNLADTQLKLGIAAQQRGETDTATGHFQSAEKILEWLSNRQDFAQSADFLVQYSFCLAKQERFEQAANWSAKLVENFPDYQFANQVALDAGKYYLEADKYESAQKWLQFVADKNDKQRSEAIYLLCRTHLKQDRFTQALALADAELEVGGEPFRERLMMARADALFGIPERQSEATVAYEQLAETFPEHSQAPLALYYAAYGRMIQQEYEPAIKAANQFRERYGDNDLLPDTMIVLARSAKSAGQADLAKRSYTQLLTRFPNHEKRDWWKAQLGWILYQQADFHGSVAHLSQAILDMQDKTSISESHYAIGLSQFELQNFPKAIESFQASITANTDRQDASDIQIWMARSHAMLNENQQAIAIADQVWKSEQSPDAAYWLGEFHYSAGDFERSIESYRLVLGLETERGNQLRPEALYGLAWAFSSAGNAEKSLECFDDLLTRHAGHRLVSSALIGRGKARRLASDFAGAIEDLNQFLANDPNPKSKFEALYERSLCHVGRQDWPAALGDLKTLEPNVADYPELADDILFDLAWAFRETGQTEQALKTFAVVADQYAESPLAAKSNAILGQALYQQGDQLLNSETPDNAKAIASYDQAIDRYQKAYDKTTDIELGELSAYRIAWCHFKKEDYPQALSAFKKQTQDYPKGKLHSQGLSMVAESHHQMKQHAQAVTVYKVVIPEITDKATNFDSETQILHSIHAAQSANNVKSFDQALRYANKVTGDFPESAFAADAWYETGVAHKGLGSEDQAIAAWQKAIELSFGRTGARARCMIGETFFAEKKYAEAIGQFEKVIYGYGGLQSATEIKPWQAFAAYEAARCSYVQINDAENPEKRAALVKEARRLFQWLVENHKDDRLATEARKQIEILDRLK